MSPRRIAGLRDAHDSVRDHLVRVTQRLLARHGVAGLTVREIAREGQVASGILYNHFPDKDELVATALREQLLESLAQLPDPAPVAAGRAGTATVAQHLETYIREGVALHRAQIPLMAGVFGAPDVFARLAPMMPDVFAHATARLGIEDYLRAEQQLGRVGSGIDARAAAQLIEAACMREVTVRLLADHAGPASSAATTPGDAASLVAVLLAGLNPDDDSEPGRAG